MELRRPVLGLAALTLPLLSTGPVGAQEVTDEGTGPAEVVLLRTTASPVAKGESGWIHLTWTTTIADAEQFAVTATMPDGTEVGYPENTEDHSSLYWDDALAISEIDYTALNVAMPADIGVPLVLDVTLRYVSQGEEFTDDLTVIVPFEEVIDGPTAPVEPGDEGPTTTTPSTTAPSTTEPSTTEPSTTAPSTTAPSTTQPEPTEQVIYDSAVDGTDGWVFNPYGSDTATTGLWEFTASPDEIVWSGFTTQLGSTPSGGPGLFTTGARGASTGVNDVDNGVTSVLSPTFDLPAGDPSLELSWYFAFLDNADVDDHFTVWVVTDSGAEVLVRNNGRVDTEQEAAWRSETFDLAPWAGTSVRFLIEAADLAEPSLIEAAVADLRISAFI